MFKFFFYFFLTTPLHFAYAVNYTWQNGGGNADWSTTNNWDLPGYPDDAADRAEIGNAAIDFSPNLNEDITLQELIFSSSQRPTITGDANQDLNLVDGISFATNAAGALIDLEGTLTFSGANSTIDLSAAAKNAELNLEIDAQTISSGANPLSIFGAASQNHSLEINSNSTTASLTTSNLKIAELDVQIRLDNLNNVDQITFEDSNSSLQMTIAGGSQTVNTLFTGQASPITFIPASAIVTITNTNNDYQGQTRIQGLSMQFSADSLPEQGGVLLEGIGSGILFNQQGATKTSYGGAISGSGSVGLRRGSLTFQGENKTYTGETEIIRGTLTGSAKDFPTGGEIFVDNLGNLVIDLSNENQTFSSTMTGKGDWFKQGGYTLDLEGDQSGFLGSLTIEEGAISLSSSTDLSNANSITIELGAALKGTGTACSVTNSGTVSPGNSIGTLTIDGDYTQNIGATLNIEVSPASSDQLNVTGNASILGGTLSLSIENGNYPKGKVFSFLNVDGTLTGDFDQIINSSPVLISATISGMNFILTVLESINILPLPIQSLKGNAKRAGDYLFANSFVPSDPDLYNIYIAFWKMPANVFPTNLIKISPLIYSALPRTCFQNDLSIAQAFTKCLRDGCQKTKRQLRKERKIARKKRLYQRTQRGYYKAFDEKEKLQVFFEPLYTFYNQYSDQGALTNVGQPAYKSNTYGFVSGIYYSIHKYLHLSWGLGYTHSSIFWQKNLGNGKWNSLYLSPSLSFGNSKYFINILFLSSFNFCDLKRKIQFCTYDRQAKYLNTAYDLMAGLETGRIFAFKNNWYSECQLKFYYDTSILPSRNELNAGSLNLHLNKKITVYLQPRLEFAIFKDYYSNFFCFTPKIYLGWLANIPTSNPMIKSHFIKEFTNRRYFLVKGYRETTNQLIVGTQFIVKKCEAFRFTSSFEWDTLSRSNLFKTYLKLEWSF